MKISKSSWKDRDVKEVRTHKDLLAFESGTVLIWKKPSHREPVQRIFCLNKRNMFHTLDIIPSESGFAEADRWKSARALEKNQDENYNVEVDLASLHRNLKQGIHPYQCNRPLAAIHRCILFAYHIPPGTAKESRRAACLFFFMGRKVSFRIFKGEHRVEHNAVSPLSEQCLRPKCTSTPRTN